MVQFNGYIDGAPVVEDEATILAMELGICDAAQIEKILRCTLRVASRVLAESRSVGFKTESVGAGFVVMSANYYVGRELQGQIGKAQALFPGDEYVFRLTTETENASFSSNNDYVLPAARRIESSIRERNEAMAASVRTKGRAKQKARITPGSCRDAGAADL